MKAMRISSRCRGVRAALFFLTLRLLCLSSSLDPQPTAPCWISLWRAWGRSWSTRRLTCWPATGRTVPARRPPVRSEQDDTCKQTRWVPASVFKTNKLCHHVVHPLSWSCPTPWRCSRSTWTAWWKRRPWSAAQSSRQMTGPTRGCHSWPWLWRTRSCSSTHGLSR